MEQNELSSEIAEIAQRVADAQAAAGNGNTAAMVEALAEASLRLSELLKDVEVEGRGNHDTRLQNTDV